ncbi:MAG: mechanosensitive ion channel family protein, partial [Victivallales bacterium]|nr:mechanosensitive ion channel family protein [Victivallales bacterium]
EHKAVTEAHFLETRSFLFTLILTTFLACGVWFLRLPSGVASVLYKCYFCIGGYCILRLATSVLGHIAGYFKDLAKKKGATYDELLIDLLLSCSKVTLWSVAILFGAQNIFGLNISSILAGAGVLGLAIAFAAQNTISNIFGAISLILDKPFKIGDMIQVDGDTTKAGIVVAIGLRSTKVRSLDGMLWFIPNSELSAKSIRNVSRRPNFKHSFDIGLTYSSSGNQIQQAQDILREALEECPLIDSAKQPSLIHFTEFKDWSLNINVIVWFQTTSFLEFMKERDQLNLKILERFNAAGLNFAFPSNTTYLAGTSAPLHLIQDNPKP